MGMWHEDPGNLSDKEWSIIEEALKNSKYKYIVGKMRELKNKPTMARMVLYERDVNNGNDKVSNVLRNSRVPFRFSRVGPAYTSTEDRRDRLLAFVRFSSNQN